mmetsp:Transcript_16825/g.34606  ORF Transcript_16825/g.34606 Transcript_16825/m.34606 type:complete len:85 (-) Transcript_16825:61-315(-)
MAWHTVSTKQPTQETHEKYLLLFLRRDLPFDFRRILYLSTCLIDGFIKREGRKQLLVCMLIRSNENLAPTFRTGRKCGNAEPCT